MGTNQTAEDITTLALHVLTGAGFGISYSFKTGLQTSQPGHSMTYRDALQTILQNGLFVFIFPHRLLTSSFSTKKMRTIGYSILEFKKYMEEMVKREKGLISRRDIGAGNLMSSLVRASEEANESPGKGSINRGLSEEEIYGNLFFYNLAGHETTANTLSYCILLLAAYPEWQAWLAEEISQVLGGQEGIETWEYQKVFPQLKRCLALMVSVTTFFLVHSRPFQPLISSVTSPKDLVSPLFLHLCNRFLCMTYFTKLFMARSSRLFACMVP